LLRAGIFHGQALFYIMHNEVLVAMSRTQICTTITLGYNYARTVVEVRYIAHILGRYEQGILEWTLSDHDGVLFSIWPNAPLT
jgi:hypothetical protein